MGADERPFGMDRIGPHVALVGSDADRVVDFGQLAKFLKAAVHGLVGERRKGFVVLEWDVLVLFKDGLCNVVQFDGHTVNCFYGGHVYVVPFDVAAAKVVGIGVPQAGETAEKEDVPDGLQLGTDQVKVSDSLHLIFGKEENGVLRLLERGLEGF